MCGIIAGFHKKKRGPANGWVVDQYEEQHNRGSLGFGIVRIDGNMKADVLRSTEPAKFMHDLHKKDVLMMLAHHRQPTSTPNKLGQTHPIFVSHPTLLKKSYLIVHNGVIANDDDLEQIHTRLGFEYVTKMIKTTYSHIETEVWNDSEPFAIEVALFIERYQEYVGAAGSAAFVALELNKESLHVERVHFGRNERNPLKLAASRDFIHLSSEGHGVDIEPFKLYSFDPKGNLKLTKRHMPFVGKSLPKVAEVKTTATPNGNQSSLPTVFKKKTDIIHVGAHMEETDSETKPVTGFKTPVEREKEAQEANATEESPIDDIRELLFNSIEVDIDDMSISLDDPEMLLAVDIDSIVKAVRSTLETIKTDALRLHVGATADDFNFDMPVPAYDNPDWTRN